MHLTTVLAATALVLTASQAEARARFKSRSSSPAPIAQPARPVAGPPASASGSSVVPGALVGAAIGSRAARAARSDDIPTASTAKLDLPPYVPAASLAGGPAAAPAKTPPPCAADRTFGRGIGFCNLN